MDLVNPRESQEDFDMYFTMQEGGFGLADYLVFGLLILLSCAGGIWYSALGSRSKAMGNIRDYLLGGKTMKTFPVALSLIASYVSGVTILGTPTEIYNYGLQYFLIIIPIASSCVVVIWFYLPVFNTLRLNSSYEYLQLRFNRNIRAVASILFMIDEVLFLPMVVYVPALAFNQLTGISVFVVAVAMVIVCGLYTALGGLKAVVWTDAVQTGIMFAGCICIVIAGTVAVGGPGAIIDITRKNNRLKVDNFSFSPYERQSGWAVIIGGFFYWLCFNSVNQTMVQRYIALPTLKKSKNAVVIFCFGAMLAICVCVWTGLTAWTAWVQGGCVKSGSPVATDRLLPSFVTFVTRSQKLPGLSGVFLAGVFGAGLSSMSCVLNACALVVIEDILHGWLKKRLKPFIEGIIARIATLILAITAILMLFVIEKLGGVLGVATALSAISASTSCGIFTLGMACWWVGPRGALCGGLAGAIVSGTISFGTQVAAGQGLRAAPMNFNKDCAANASFFISNYTHNDADKFFPLFRISYHWIAPLGLLSTLIVGMIGGYLLDKDHIKIYDCELFSPCIWRFLPPEFKSMAGEVRRLQLVAARRFNQDVEECLMQDTVQSNLQNSQKNGKVPVEMESRKTLEFNLKEPPDPDTKKNTVSNSKNDKTASADPNNDKRSASPDPKNDKTADSSKNKS